MANSKEKMFCYQCEQRAGDGCTIEGACGKDPETALMQDLLVWQTMGLAQYARRLALKGIREKEFGHFIIEALFTTVTNVNFDSREVEKLVKEAEKLKRKASLLYEKRSRRTP